MKYLSRNGCLFYFDRVTYDWRFSEPTMLFLLGFESVTTFDNSGSDVLKVSRYAYHSYDGTLEAYVGFDIFDKIYGFLSLMGNIDDHETYTDFDCNGIKLLLNEYTGISDDRTVPIIFKDDINKTSVDLQSTMNRIPEIDYINYSINDLRAQKISDIFTDAKYNDQNYKSEFLSLSYTTDTVALSVASVYNDKITALHDERKFNNNIYRLIDYKAMYSYALGVLYGCRCLGYDKESIWRLNPKYWYNGAYTNLVETAWDVFRFHYTNKVDSQDEHYQDIVLNKLWNFTNDLNSDVILYSDEIEVASVAISDDLYGRSLDLRPIIYSNDHQRYIPLYTEDVDLNQWIEIDDNIIDKTNEDVPTRDLIDVNNSYTRYLGNYPIKMFPPYRDTSINNYLEGYCFVSTGNIGWVKYDKNDFNLSIPNADDNDKNNYLSIYPIQLTKISSNNFEMAVEKGTGIANIYYIGATHTIEFDDSINSYVAVTTAKIYGLTTDFVLDDEWYPVINEGASFYRVVDETTFGNEFTTTDEFPDEIYESGLMPAQLYDLSNKIYVIANAEDPSLIYNGLDGWVLLIETGYSYYPATDLSVYIKYGTHIFQSSLRYYIRNSSVYYWDPMYSELGWQPQTAQDPLPNNAFFLYGSSVLYRNIVKFADNISIYSNEVSVINGEVKPKQNPSNRSVFIGGNFVSLDTLYNNQGITEYLCEIVYEDDFGHPLLDQEGNPAVWYDQSKNLYWNGLLTTPTWQTGKPILDGILMYNSTTNALTSVIDNSYTHTITIGINVISYTDFYNNANYGLIRESLHVYTDLSGIIDCYYDSYSDKYCIPNITDPWTTRQSIIDLGYRFVDGQEVLYDGDTPIEVVVDSDNTD